MNWSISMRKRIYQIKGNMSEQHYTTVYDEMALLALLVIVHEYVLSHLIPHHKLIYDSAVAYRHLREILTKPTNLVCEKGLS